MDVEACKPELDTLIGLPSGTRLRLATLGSAESLTGKIMLIQFADLDDKNLTASAGPPNIGYFMLSFLVDDLDGLSKKLTDAGTMVTCSPRPIDFGPEGVWRAMSVLSPDGVKLEFKEQRR